MKKTRRIIVGTVIITALLLNTTRAYANMGTAIMAGAIMGSDNNKQQQTQTQKFICFRSTEGKEYVLNIGAIKAIKKTRNTIFIHLFDDDRIQVKEETYQSIAKHLLGL